MLECNLALQKSISLTSSLPTHMLLNFFFKTSKKPLLLSVIPGDFSNGELENFPHSAAVSVPAEASAVCSCPFGTTKSNSNISDMDKAWASIIQQGSQLCRESSMPKWTPHGPQREKLCVLYYWVRKSLNLSVSGPSGARSIARSS